MEITKTVTLTHVEQEIMRVRCDEDGHKWTNGCSPWFQIYMVCKWCGAQR